MEVPHPFPAAGQGRTFEEVLRVARAVVDAAGDCGTATPWACSPELRLGGADPANDHDARVVVEFGRNLEGVRDR
ncbi:hypothetical protein ABZ826_12075 [Streptomyces sp. NPDC047515]|uniref:hypothetical protein n=1 Tax=Streptomyces sp. NPDC047515 TaxID=3155380 RepID=UPI0033D53447